MVRWIFVDYEKCSGCRACEVECSLTHEGIIWREASRIRIVEPLPGITIPVVCVQCTEKYCMKSCRYDAIYLDSDEVIHVDSQKCTGCGSCINACPAHIPIMHPQDSYVLICDLCGGEPACVDVCSSLGYEALKVVESDTVNRDLYLKNVEEIAEEIFKKIYGEV